MSYNISPSLSDFLHSVWQSLGPFTLLQMVLFHSFWWLIFHCIYMYHIFLIRLSVDGHLGCFHVLTIHCQTSFTKIRSRWIKDLNVRPDTVKLLEENRQNTLWHKLQQYLFYPSPKIMETKTNRWDLCNLKNFCTAKETINKMKRQLTDWEKIFANDMTDKRLFSKIYNFSRSSSPPGDWTRVSCIAGISFTIWAPARMAIIKKSTDSKCRIFAFTVGGL